MNQFYVYQLVDPRDGLPFYVGKGSGRRMYQHVSEARGRVEGNSAKQTRILEIEAAGLFVGHVKVRDGLTETDAYRLERELIANTPGLTNIAPGGTSSQEKARQRAILLLKLFKEPEVWLAEKPRSLEQMEMYRIVLLGLMSIARPMKATHP